MIGTSAYLALFAIYALFEWQALLAMKPNEFADFLAGCFAPLAFLWLVLGFFQQGDELRNSVAALHLQGEELRNSVEQQRQLVEVTREQLGLDHAKRLSEAETAVRQAQPIFHISGGFSSWSSPISTSVFGVGNIGPECRKLRFSGGEGTLIQKALFKKGDIFSVEYALRKGDEIRPLTLTIDCTDLLGNDLQFEMVLEPLDGRYGPEYRISRDDGLFTKVSQG
jgi:hypothetical protein